METHRRNKKFFSPFSNHEHLNEYTKHERIVWRVSARLMPPLMADSLSVGRFVYTAWYMRGLFYMKRFYWISFDLSTLKWSGNEMDWTLQQSISKRSHARIHALVRSLFMPVIYISNEKIIWQTQWICHNHETLSMVFILIKSFVVAAFKEIRKISHKRKSERKKKKKQFENKNEIGKVCNHEECMSYLYNDKKNPSVYQCWSHRIKCKISVIMTTKKLIKNEKKHTPHTYTSISSSTLNKKESKCHISTIIFSSCDNKKQQQQKQQS